MMDFERKITTTNNKKKRLASAIILVLAIISGIYIGESQATRTPIDPPAKTTGSPVEAVNSEAAKKFGSASEGLSALEIKGRAPKTGYTRSQFGSGWEESGGCDTRNRILARDLTEVLYEVNSCVVLSGKLNDPYTGKQITFTRGSGTSTAVQIDHVVALSDAWQKGGQLLTPLLREQLANDGLNLLAVDGPANMQKSDGDAATWLPPNKAVRCNYVARQVSVKLKYSLWVTSAEKTAIEKVLKDCPEQQLAS
jgi:hypothetical protein